MHGGGAGGRRTLNPGRGALSCQAEAALDELHTRHRLLRRKPGLRLHERGQVGAGGRLGAEGALEDLVLGESQDWATGEVLGQLGVASQRVWDGEVMG